MVGAPFRVTNRETEIDSVGTLGDIPGADNLRAISRGREAPGGSGQKRKERERERERDGADSRRAENHETVRREAFT